MYIFIKLHLTARSFVNSDKCKYLRNLLNILELGGNYSTCKVCNGNSLYSERNNFFSYFGNTFAIVNSQSRKKKLEIENCFSFQCSIS